MYEDLETIAQLRFGKERETISALTQASVREAQARYAALIGSSGVRSGQHEAAVAREWIQGAEKIARSFVDIWVDLIRKRNGYFAREDVGFIAGRVEDLTKSQTRNLKSVFGQRHRAIAPTLSQEAESRMRAVSADARRDLEIMAREHEAFSEKEGAENGAPKPPSPKHTSPNSARTSNANSEKSDKGLFVGIIGIAIPLVLAISQANGVDLNWLISMALYIVSACVCAWSFARHAVPHKGRLIRYGGAILFSAGILAIGSYGTFKQYRREHPSIGSKPPVITPGVEKGPPGSAATPPEAHTSPPPRSPRQAGLKERPAELKPPALVPIFFDKDNLSFRLGNLWDTAATEPKFTIGLANLSKQYLASYDGKEPRPQPLPIPTKKVDDFVRPHESIEKFIVINDLSKPYVKTGDKLFGQFWLSCQNCDKWRYYLLYWQVGMGGWYSEIPTSQAPGTFVTSPNLSDQEIDKDIDDLVPVVARTAIFPDYETMLKATRP